jgi:glycosyltransferase involved in cell wall biosynthesis
MMPHGMLDPYSLGVKSWRKRAYLWAMERRNLAAARRLIFTSLEEARLASSRGADCSGMVVVPLGGDAPSEDHARLRAEFVATFPQIQGRRHVLFLGRLHFKKGLDRLLGALQRVRSTIPDVFLTIAGDGSPRFVSDLRAMIVAKKLQECVLLTGPLEGTLKWGAYASADVFVLVSRQENFALTVAEAMHAGIPVIISDKVNTWPLVQESGGGVVLSEDNIESSLAAAMASILSDWEHGEMLGKRGQVFARNRLTWAGTVRTLLSCYEAVLNESGTAAQLKCTRGT